MYIFFPHIQNKMGIYWKILDMKHYVKIWYHPLLHYMKRVDYYRNLTSSACTISLVNSLTETSLSLDCKLLSICCFKLLRSFSRTSTLCHACKGIIIVTVLWVRIIFVYHSFKGRRATVFQVKIIFCITFFQRKECNSLTERQINILTHLAPVTYLALNYLPFLSFDFWWRLFQKRFVHTKFDIYVFIAQILIFPFRAFPGKNTW